VAIETRDDTLFEEDASLVYLHTTLDPDQEPVRYYREYHSQDSEVSNIGFFDDLLFSQESIAESGVRSAVGRVGDVTVYEWAFKLSPPDLEQIAANSYTRFRFDVGLLDKDNDDGDDEFRLSWSPNPDKDEKSALLGCLTFANERSQLVQVQGTLVGVDKTPLPGVKIRVEHAQRSWIDEIATGAKGRFSTWALPGDLQITVKGLAAADTVHLATRSGDQPEVQLIAPHFNAEIRPVLASTHEPGTDPPFLLEGARFRIGDDPSWSAADFDDSDWEVFRAEPRQFDVPDGARVLWIRQRLIADRGISSQPLVIKPYKHRANSVTYFLNGSQLLNYHPLHPREADARTTITLGHMEPDLLVTRYAFNRSVYFSDRKPHYNLVISDANSSVQNIIEHSQISISNLSMFIGMPLMLCVLHLLTYWFYRNQKEHWYYAVFTASIAGATILRMGREHFDWSGAVSAFGTMLLFLLLQWALMRFVSTLFKQQDTRLYKVYQGSAFTISAILLTALGADRLARFNLFNLAEPDFFERLQFYYAALLPFTFLLGLSVWLARKNRWPDRSRLRNWSAGIVLVPALAGFIDSDLFPLIFLTLLMVFLIGVFAALQCIYRALRAKMPGSATIAAGTSMYVIFVIGATIHHETFGTYPLPPYEFFSIGFFAIILAISVHLARVVGTTGRSLEEQLVRVESLSETNLEQERALRQRMEEELEEAHKLQISMLPDHVPEHPSAEVDWAMKTATEVGGDYYDYRIADDGKLTLILGDATGHGMQAGTLVTATKSLFQGLKMDNNLADTVTRMSLGLKSMNLNRLGMALTLVELDGHQLRYCAAGIPPMLIYRAREDKVEEGETGGLPLGLTTRGSYQQTELTLESGDTLLLISDGLAERTNEVEEEFGYKRAHDLFHEVATDTPAEICRKMAAGGDAWAAGKEQDDDVSFLAVRIR
jgi:serine phosphatase RsbU (regulator of sigma subunit)